MRKETIEYTDYNGKKQKKECYFNLTKAELMKLEVTEKGGLSEKLKKISKDKDPQKIFDFIENLILMSYGKRTEDGEGFIKSPELRDAFAQTEAFSELFAAIATSEDRAIAFIKGILPMDVSSQITTEKIADAKKQLSASK